MICQPYSGLFCDVLTHVDRIDIWYMVPSNKDGRSFVIKAYI